MTDQSIMTVANLRDALLDYPDDTPVMVCVVKYPERFAIRKTHDGEWRWDLGDDVEMVPLEPEDMSLLDGILTLNVELNTFGEAMNELQAPIQEP